MDRLFSSVYFPAMLYWLRTGAVWFHVPVIIVIVQAFFGVPYLVYASTFGMVHAMLMILGAVVCLGAVTVAVAVPRAFITRLHVPHLTKIRALHRQHVYVHLTLDALAGVMAIAVLRYVDAAAVVTDTMAIGVLAYSGSTLFFLKGWNPLFFNAWHRAYGVGDPPV